MGGVEFWLFAVIHLLIVGISVRFFYKIGARAGARREVMDMIELLDALKMDNWEQSVFRDRLKGALQWTLDRKRKKDRDATPPSAP